MSSNIFEDGALILTRYAGPNGTPQPHYQVNDRGMRFVQLDRDDARKIGHAIAWDLAGIDTYAATYRSSRARQNMVLVIKLLEYTGSELSGRAVPFEVREALRILMDAAKAFRRMVEL